MMALPLKKLLSLWNRGIGILFLFSFLLLDARFSNFTSQAGIGHTQFSSNFEPTVELQILTGGAAAGDFDGDGWVDLFVTRLDGRDILYRNRGASRAEGEPWFENVTEQAGIHTIDRTNGAAWGDIDNDGDLDLYVSTIQSSRYYLYINQGDGTFTEEAIARGAALQSSLGHRGFSIAFGDYDRDGWLDIHTCEWGIDSTHPSIDQHVVLLRNQGTLNPGYFVNTTEFSNADAGPDRVKFSFTSTFSDLDDDQWPDLLVAADFTTSEVFWNNGDGTFTEGAKAAGLSKGVNEMGSAVGDYNLDGRLDWFVTSTATDNRLYENLGNRQFAERAAELGVDDGGWGWGTEMFDYDNDGDLDIIMTNGWHQVEAPETQDTFIDPIYFWENEGGTFTQLSSFASGLRDTGEGKGLLTFDFDRDGDLDVYIVNNGGPSVLYRNSTENSNHWLQIKLNGTVSNRHGIGSKVTLTTTEGSQARVYELSGDSQFLGQSESIIHAGLGSHGVAIASIEIRWPSGIVQTLQNITPNQRIEVTENGTSPYSPPVFSNISASQMFDKDTTVTISAPATGTPTPLYTWYKDGVVMPEAQGSEFTIPHIKPHNTGNYIVIASNPGGSVQSTPIQVGIRADIDSKSIAQWWNEALLDAIRLDFPDPTLHGRNLYHLSSAMWDAYWAYEPNAWQTVTPAFQQEILSTADWGNDRIEAQKEAISYAAYRLIKHRFTNSSGAVETLQSINWLMAQLGYDTSITEINGTTPAIVGNRIAAAVIAATLNDGANEANGYADNTNYVSVNEPMVVATPGAIMTDPNRWQPLSLSFSITQNGIIEGANTQEFIGENARLTIPFALEKPTPSTIALDPGPHPMLGGVGHEQLVNEVVQLIEFSAQLDPRDGLEIDISPGTSMNNPLGTNDGTGYPVNPATGAPYAPNIVLRADYARIMAEFWADGPDSETPPGHWNVLFNEIQEHPDFQRLYRGQGTPLDPLRWDIVGYLALNGAMHDAACAAWTVKRQYDSSRPISLIRYMGGLGQSTNSTGPSYHEMGLPLIPELIEVATAESLGAGGKHASALLFTSSQDGNHVGKIVIRTWTGNPLNPKSDLGGVNWIFADEWNPYQKDTFVTPAFPGYISGHSTFSRAGAEVMNLLTGSAYFPGGLGIYHFPANSFLKFEIGPERDFTLQWATYYDAADQAGLSRIYGGIHIAADDVVGRILGSQVGIDAFNKAAAMYGQ